MSKSIAILVGLVLLVSLVLFSMTFTVSFHEVAIKTRFGKTTADSIITQPGLKFRLPLFADSVTTFDTRLQLRETPIETIQTSDGQQVMVKAFMMWKVDTKGDGPLKFYQSYSTIDEANQFLVDQFRSALKSGLSRYSFDDLIGPRSRLADAEQAIKSEMLAVQGSGIEPVNVGLSQLILPAKTTTAVLNRMQATRTKLAEGERQKGNVEKKGIEDNATTQVEKIRTFADQRAAEIKSVGQEDVAKYLTLMNKEPELAIFLAWRDAFQNTLSSHTTVILPTAWAPFHFLQLNTPTNAQGIPQPTSQNSLKMAPAPVVTTEDSSKNLKTDQKVETADQSPSDQSSSKEGT